MAVRPSLLPARTLALTLLPSAVEDASALLPVGDAPSAEAVALITSGLTASIALEQAAQLRRGDTVLVTAAAGGTGMFAVQLAAAAGARVVATCGGAAKAQLLRSLGAHRVIDHTAESVKAVLRAEFRAL
jgi:NADPH:quinone reductase-like Zn-dependent oxidoreductase